MPRGKKKKPVRKPRTPSTDARMLEVLNRKAQERADLLCDAVKRGTYGKCPPPPQDYIPLSRNIEMYIAVSSGKVEVRVAHFSKRERAYLVGICGKLGFEAAW